MACAKNDLVCGLVDWLIQNIEFPLLLVIGFGLVYMVWLAGNIAGQKEGFINGIMHYIHLKAYNTADFPEVYERDDYVRIAQGRLARNLRPKIPADIRDEA